MGNINLAKTKTFGRSWLLLIVYLGHITFKKSDILKSDRFLYVDKSISLVQRLLACTGNLTARK